VVSTAAIGNKRREVARIITVLADLKGRA
jgi:ribosomal protein L29